MKNLLVLTYEYPPIGGGGGICAFNLNREFSKIGYKVFVVTTWYKYLPEKEETDNIAVFRLRSKRKNTFRSNPIEMLDWAKKATQFSLQLTQQQTIDYCLAHFVLPGGLVAQQLKRKRKIPFTVISHGHDIPWVKPLNLYPLFAASYFKIKGILRSSQYVVTLSHSLQKGAQKLLKGQQVHKVKLIANGADASVFYPKPKSKDGVFRILFVGRLTTQKRPNWLLEASKKSNIPNFELTFIGDGPLRAYLERRKPSNTKLLGKLPQAEVIKQIQNADVLVIPSQSEGFSLVMLEALFCNTFVLTTNVSGAEVVIKNQVNGVFFKSIDELAELLNKVHRNSFDEQLKTKENEQVRKSFSWEQIAKKYKALF